MTILSDINGINPYDDFDAWLAEVAANAPALAKVEPEIKTAVEMLAIEMMDAGITSNRTDYIIEMMKDRAADTSFFSIQIFHNGFTRSRVTADGTMTRIAIEGGGMTVNESLYSRTRPNGYAPALLVFADGEMMDSFETLGARS